MTYVRVHLLDGSIVNLDPESSAMPVSYDGAVAAVAALKPIKGRAMYDNCRVCIPASAVLFLEEVGVED